MGTEEAPTAGAVFRPDDAVLAGHPDLYGGTPGQRAMALASALPATPVWQSLRKRARIVVRTDPSPLIGMVGNFETDDQSMLRALGWQVEDSLTRLRAVSWGEVEQGCALVADKLVDHLGEKGIQRCRLVGVPRGGLIVAGLLAYSLGLSHAQLETEPLQDEVRVIVDDCMLSGARLRRWLRAHPGPPVVVAHLHSHPALRAAVERDASVARCMAAADLRDHAPDRQGADYEEWQRRWAQRSPDDFWTGHPDHVCYPWNEPDTLVWNPITERAEAGWRVVPPSWCLKNRRESAGTAGDVQLCTPPNGSVGVPPGVVWGDLGDNLILLDGDRGHSLTLRGTAADFWRAVVGADSTQSAATKLAKVYAAEVELLHADLEQFVATLVSHGLLESAE